MLILGKPWHVRSVNFRWLLAGSIPTSLGALTKLEQLRLHNNQLTGKKGDSKHFTFCHLSRGRLYLLGLALRAHKSGVDTGKTMACVHRRD